MRSGNAKLTDDQVRGILALRPSPVKGGPLARELAQTYGVSEAAIMRVWRRQSYAHVRR